MRPDRPNCSGCRLKVTAGCSLHSRHICACAAELRRTALQGVMVTLYPLHAFFAFLYYTDVGSTLCVLASYLVRAWTPLPAISLHFVASAQPAPACRVWRGAERGLRVLRTPACRAAGPDTAAAVQACLQQRTLLSGLLGAAAVLFRQTNAVWVAFILGVHPVSVSSRGSPAA